jgi:glycosyltransferase involved in cell wall biosynthesis
LNKGSNVGLNLYGEGVERNNLEAYITKNNLTEIISLKEIKIKQQKKDINKVIYVASVKSEGWPKAIAEGMFWGCIPVGTAVSCVPFMLDEGKRGFYWR